VFIRRFLVDMNLCECLLCTRGPLLLDGGRAGELDVMAATT